MAELSPEMLQLLLGAIIAVSAGAVIYLFVNPYLSGEVQRDKRMQGVTESRANRSQARTRDDELQSRRMQVADSLKEIENRQKAREKITLRLRLQRAGLDITPNAFWIASGVVGLIVGGLTFYSTPGMAQRPLISLAAVGIGILGKSLSRCRIGACWSTTAWGWLPRRIAVELR